MVKLRERLRLAELSKNKNNIDLFSIDEIEKIDLQGYEQIILGQAFDMESIIQKFLILSKIIF